MTATEPTAPTGQRAYDVARHLWAYTSNYDANTAAESVMAHMDASLGFDVYCAPHRRKHRLGIRDVERLIYGLQGELSDARTEPAEDRQEAGEAGWKVAAEMCPLESLNLAGDSEGYAEHVDSMVESRVDSAVPDVT